RFILFDIYAHRICSVVCIIDSREQLPLISLPRQTLALDAQVETVCIRQLDTIDFRVDGDEVDTRHRGSENGVLTDHGRKAGTGNELPDSGKSPATVQ